MAIVLPLFSRAPKSRDWANDELAELYRVQHALVQANVALETDRGVTDEGDPWFVFCRPDGDVLVHIARFDGLYHLFSPALPEPLTGPSFSVLTRAFVSVVPMSAKQAASSRIALHPSALLSLLVVTIFFSFDKLMGNGGRAEAAEATDKVAPNAKTTYARKIAANMFAALNLADAARAEEAAWIAGQAAVLVALAGLLDDTVVGTPTATDDVRIETAALTTAGSLLSAAATEVVASESTAATAATDAGATHRAAETAATAPSLLLAALVTPAAAAEVAVPTLAVTGSVIVDTTVTIAVSGGSTLHPTLAGVERLDVTVTAGGGVLDLSGAESLRLIALSGDGTLTVTGLSGDGTQKILVSAGSDETLRLDFSPTTAVTTVAQVVEVAGGSTVVVDALTVHGTTDTTVDLTVESSGGTTNTVTVPDAVTRETTLNLKIVGSQDVVLNESASALDTASLDASALQGQLTVGIDFSGTSHLTTLVGSSDFVVNDNGIVGLMNVPDGATIQIGTNLASVLAQIDDNTDSTSLTLDLLSAKTVATAVSVGVVKVAGAETLILGSDGGSDIVNSIKALIDPELSRLEISGSASLTIGSIQGITADQTQSITIDASALTGQLTLDVSTIADVTGGGRSVTLIGGHGADTLTNSNASEVTVFTGGDGLDVFNVAAGASAVTVTDLQRGETVNIGTADTADVVVDATHVSGVDQSYYDAQTLLAAATQAGYFAASTASHQAVLFNYRGTAYVFVDADGDHTFDAATDAVVQIVGTVSLTDLAHVFYSA